MRPSRASGLAWAGVATAAVLTGAGLTFMALNLAGDRVDTSDAIDPSIVWIAAFTVVGAVVGARRPSNPIGWIFLGSGIGWAVFYLATQYALFALITEENSVPGGLAAEWLSLWIWVPSFLAAATFALALFPDGSLPSRRWRFLPWLAGLVFVLSVVGQAARPGRLDPPLQAYSNPLGSSVLGGLWDLTPFAIIIVVVLAAASLVSRHRRSGTEEREQIKWVVAAAVLLGLSAALASPWYGSSVLAQAAVSLGIVALPAATGIAILKYRLYDIDRIVNRAVVYGVLTAGLAGLYFGIVLGLEQVFSGLTRGNDLAIAGSTLAVAALFRPARRRIQAIVDRRFYRQRYDSQQTLEAFSQRLRDEVDLDALGADLGAVVHETMQPAHVSLWLRAPGEQR